MKGSLIYLLNKILLYFRRVDLFLILKDYFSKLLSTIYKKETFININIF